MWIYLKKNWVLFILMMSGYRGSPCSATAPYLLLCVHRRRVNQNPSLVCTPFARRQLTRPPKWLLSSTEEHLQPRSRKTITWAVKPHVDRTMLMSMNCQHQYPFRLSTKKISRDIFDFTELLSVSRKSIELEQYFICCRRLLIVRSKYLFSSTKKQIHGQRKTF
jgi:hypothetical protein